MEGYSPKHLNSVCCYYNCLRTGNEMKGGMNKMVNEKNGNEMSSWDGFLGSNFLSVDNVKNETDAFACIGVELDTENNRPMLILEKEEITYKFSLNVTNANFVKDAGIKSPEKIIGKVMCFRQTMAFSPKSKKDVPSLRISKIV